MCQVGGEAFGAAHGSSDLCTSISRLLNLAPEMSCAGKGAPKAGAGQHGGSFLCPSVSRGSVWSTGVTDPLCARGSAGGHELGQHRVGTRGGLPPQHLLQPPAKCRRRGEDENRGGKDEARKIKG